MSGEQISHALGSISDAALESAMDVYKRKQNRRGILRLTAIAAVIAILMTALLWPSEENYVTGPGVLTVYAHGVDEDGNATVETDILELGVVFGKTHTYNPAHSYIPDFPISFSVDKDAYYGMDLTLDIRTNTGIFENNDVDPLTGLHLSPAQQHLLFYYGQEFSVDIDKILYWRANGFDYNYLKENVAAGNEDLSQIYRPYCQPQNPSFIDIIVKANDLIVGYCIIEVRELDKQPGTLARTFSFELVSSVSFPMVGGQWQNVKYQYVEEQINNIHTEREALS